MSLVNVFDEGRAQASGIEDAEALAKWVVGKLPVNARTLDGVDLGGGGVNRVDGRNLRGGEYEV